jgi:hypothetical protein
MGKSDQKQAHRAKEALILTFGPAPDLTGGSESCDSPGFSLLPNVLPP